MSRLCSGTHGGWNIVCDTLRVAASVTAMFFVGLVVIAWIYLPEFSASRMLSVLKIAGGWLPGMFALAVVLASVGPIWVIVRLHLKLRPFGLGAWTFLAMPIEERKRLSAELGLQEG